MAITDDDPVAFDESVAAAITRAKAKIAERERAHGPAVIDSRRGVELRKINDNSFEVVVDDGPAQSFLTYDPAVAAFSALVAQRMLGSDAGAAGDGRKRVTVEVAEGPTTETLAEKWGLTFEDAQLLRGESKTTTFRETYAITCAREFLAEAASGQVKMMVLTGGRGVGKTIAAGWTMVTARPDLGKSWPVERHPVMISASKIALWGSYGFVAERDQIARCRILTIDDLGTEDTTRGFIPYLNELMNQRAGAAGFTVITCNLSVPEFSGRYGARIMDRLRQRAAWFEIDQPSLRTR